VLEHSGFFVFVVAFETDWFIFAYRLVGGVLSQTPLASRFIFLAIDFGFINPHALFSQREFSTWPL
jgi:hypothetical protein